MIPPDPPYTTCDICCGMHMECALVCRTSRGHFCQSHAEYHTCGALLSGRPGIIPDAALARGRSADEVGDDKDTDTLMNALVADLTKHRGITLGKKPVTNPVRKQFWKLDQAERTKDVEGAKAKTDPDLLGDPGCVVYKELRRARPH